jgi:hypothetical protein
LTTEPRFAYSYDPQTRAYMGTVKLQPSPDGRWHLPDYTVEAAPQRAAGDYQSLRLSQDGSHWELVDDFRNRMLWDTVTSSVVPNRLALGEKLPPGVTLSAPYPLTGGDAYFNAWNADAGRWELKPDYSNRPLWNRADGSLAAPPARGQALPASVIDQAPPAERKGPVTYDEASAAWVSVIAPGDEPATPQQL